MQTVRNNDKIHSMRDQIAARAYERFLARGGEHGHDVEDWLAAEAEIMPSPGQEAAYEVVLKDAGKGIIEVVRQIRELTGMGLPEIQSMVDALPRTIKRVGSLRDADAIKKPLERLGARVDVRLVR
jgi:ribosomal protein L7/L12